MKLNLNTPPRGSVAASFNLIVLAALLGGLAAPAAPVGTAFTYQGQMQTDSGPANGLYDLRFALFDAASLGTPVGSPVTNSAVVVSNGYFAVTLDFGAAFSEARWLEIGVRTNGSNASFTLLTPRQAITPAPNAIVASQLSGTLADAQLGANVALLNRNNQAFTGNNTFAGNVGIGTNSPSERLHVVAASATEVRVENTGGGTVALGLVNADREYSLRMTTAEKLVVRDVTAGDVDRLTIIPDGKVGIGTTAPLSALHVVGDENDGTTAAFQIVSGPQTLLLDGNEIDSSTILTLNGNSSNRVDIGGDLKVYGIINATTVVGDGVGLTGLNTSQLLDRTNVAILNRNNQKFIGNLNRFEGDVIVGTDLSDNVVLSHVGGNPDRGAINVRDENNTTAVSLRATVNGGDVDANDPAGASRATMFVGGDGAGRVWTYGPNGEFNVTVGLGATSDHGAIYTYGPSNLTTAGIYSGSNGGEIDARDVAGQNRVSMYVNSVGAGQLNVNGTNGNWNVGLGHITDHPDHGWLGVFDSAGVNRASMFINDDGQGWVSADVVQVNGGADIAEPFQIRSSDEAITSAIEPGMLVVIDPDQAGELRVSTRSYDHTVAGIISGAGGVKPGLTLRQKSTLADGNHPVALTGRVWCYVDAETAPVVPGDLLTTSDVPGHAMKAMDHAQAQGAIVGKAMTRLNHGRGLVLVLVSLQ